MKTLFLSVLLVATILLVSAAAERIQAQVAAPVVGIVTNNISWCNPAPSTVSDKTNACVEGFYVSWFQSAGIRVITIPWNTSDAKARYYFERVNAIFYPGGGLDGEVLNFYTAQARRFVQWALKEPEKAPVIIGTCQGFQVLSSIFAGTTDVIKCGYQGMYPTMMKLNLTKSAASSRMFSDAPKDVLRDLTQFDTTLNWHHCIIAESDYEKYPMMKQHLNVLSTNNVPGTNTVFGSTVEGKGSLELYLEQWHPERPPFEFTNSLISHSPETVRVSQFLADFYHGRLSLNKNRFEKLEDVEKLVINQWPEVYVGWGAKVYYVIDENN